MIEYIKEMNKLTKPRQYKVGWNCPAHKEHKTSCKDCVEISIEMETPIEELLGKKKPKSSRKS